MFQTVEEKWNCVIAGVGGLVAIVLLVMAIGIFGVSIYGLVLAFQASIILGLIALLTFKFFFPFSLAIASFCGTDAAQAITDWAGFPF